jgi:exodeoxyribonuclease VII small subunit
MVKEVTDSAITDEMSFEEAMAELEGIVKRLETGQVSLEKAIADYARGSQLRGYCEKRLASARMLVEQIIQNEKDGEITSKPFERNAS